MTGFVGATTSVVGAWISPRLYWSYAPLDIEVQPVPWWIYIGMAIALMFAGSLVSVLFLPYRRVQTGKNLPDTTVDRLLAVKDAEIVHLLEEITHWRGYAQIKDNAYTEMAGSIDEITDALQELVDGLARASPTRTDRPPPSRTTNTEAPTNARQRRRD